MTQAVSAADFEASLRARNAAALRLVVALGTALVPAFWLLDWLTIPDHVWMTLGFRVGCTAYGIAILAVGRLHPEWMERHVTGLSVSFSLAVAWSIALMCFMHEGYESPYYAGINLLILAVGLLFTWRTATAIVFMALVYLFYLAPLLIGALSIRDGMTALVNQLFLISTMIVTVLAQMHRRRLERREFDAQIALELEKAQTEALLQNILPAPIVARLKAGPDRIADRHEDVSVLFADIVDFTPLAARMTAAEVVNLLDRVFSCFDALADKHGLEKIKTIGDAYMVAGGLTTANTNHAERVAAMALDMLAAITNYRDADGQPLRLRIGIHSGPVVAGVIGAKRFLYDLWGDTVNVASRMESHGSPGTIQVTEASWRLLSASYEFAGPRDIDIKGKGRLTTYTLIALRRPQ